MMWETDRGGERVQLRKIADQIGIGKYPEELEQLYEKLPETDTPACDLELIDGLQSQYDVFGQYYALVRALAEKVNADPARSAWVKLGAAFIASSSLEQARRLPVPAPDGTALTAMLPLYILITQIPSSIRLYKSQGVEETELRGYLAAYKSGIRIVESQTGIPGINGVYYGWLLHFAKAEIFKTGGLQFEIRTLPAAAIYLRNRKSRQILPIMCKGIFHASGIQVLGSRCYEDESGAFAADFEEDGQAYWGHAVIDGVVDRQCRSYSKALWECIGRPGDSCLGLHIPRGADISAEALFRACASAKTIAAERYPEFDGKLVICESWLLDPQLGKLLGDQSKIAGFSRCFARYPNKSGGKDGFTFVFPRLEEDYKTLPEDTSLQRKLKQLYLDGDGIYTYSGIVQGGM